MIVDNGSTDRKTLDYLENLTAAHKNVRAVREDGPFNYSHLNNVGVSHARGEYLCLLNNDTEVIAEGWIETLRMHLGRPEVGAVGGKLLYTDGTIQHAGVTMGLGGLAAHPYAGKPHNTPINAAKAQRTQSVRAVTGACLATRRDVWIALGGLDDTELKIAYNDVDYCLKVWKAGMAVIYEPAVELYHHESASRGSDKTQEKINRLLEEQRVMKDRWGIWTYEDPFFSPNHDYGRADFSLSADPRVSILD